MKNFVLFALFCLFYTTNSAHLPQLPKKADEPVVEGLYDSNDKVTTVNYANVKGSIYDRPHATLLQFYNSFCGHCRRFAPHYKSIARDVYNWRNVIKIMAIDCAVDDNNDICREYEIMGYPSLRYFSPNQKDGIGRSLVGQDEEYIKSFLILSALNETNTENISSWPDFSNLQDEEKEKLFEKCPEKVEYIVLVYEPDNSTLGAHLALQFSTVEEVRFRRTTNPSVAAHFNVDSHNVLAFVDKNLNVETISVTSGELESYLAAIKNTLSLKKIKFSDESFDSHSNVMRTGADQLSDSRSDLLPEVLNNKHVVYQADLELALRYAIFHEISKYDVISGDKLLALQDFINVVAHYNPLGYNGQKFLDDLQKFIRLHNQELRGEQYQAKVRELELKHSPVFSSTKWVGCQPSKPHLRGYSCGLWQLFHYLSVRAALDESSNNPLEVLQAVHGYVKYYFGCTECSNHFQADTIKR